MAVSAELTALVKQVPGNDGEWYKGVKWDDAAKTCDGVLTNTPQNVAGLVASLNEVDNGKDFQPRYLLRILTTYVGRPEKAAAKDAVVDALVAALAGDYPKSVKGTVLRELQFLADKRAAAALAPFLADEVLNADAANALLNIREGAIDLFLAALPKATGQSRTTIVQALGTLGNPAAIGALQTAAATEKEEETQLAALWGLARLGDAGSVDVLLKASDAPAGWTRSQAGNACLLLAEKLAATGRKADATRIYEHLKETRTDKSETYLQDLATRALSS